MSVRDKKKIRILIVDDSSVMLAVIRGVLQKFDDIEIVGEAFDGQDAFQKSSTLAPDVIIMDIQMPVMNGYESTELIMAKCPTRIIILSSLIDKTDMYSSMRAIELGALEVMAKPAVKKPVDLDIFGKKLVEKIRILSRVPVISHIRGNRFKEKYIEVHPSTDNAYEIIGIGSSTGGPFALKILLSGLVKSVNVPILIVQHITKGFLEGLIDWLKTETSRKITISSKNQTLEKDIVYFIPNGYQPILISPRRLVLDSNVSPSNGFKPSIDILFRNIANVCGKNSIGIILTGMGSDGAKGMVDLKKAGALTIAQDKTTSIIYGMPKAAVEMGGVLHSLPIQHIPIFLNKIIKRSS